DQFRCLYQGRCAHCETRSALQESAVPAHARRAPKRACRRTPQRWSHSNRVEFQSLCPSPFPPPPPFPSDRMLNYTSAQLKYHSRRYRRERIEERLENTGPAQPPEPLPYRVPVAEL